MGSGEAKKGCSESSKILQDLKMSPWVVLVLLVTPGFTSA